MECIVFIHKISFARRSFLKIWEHQTDIPQFSWGTFSDMSRLDQSRTNENIWWIIIKNKPKIDFPADHVTIRLTLAGTSQLKNKKTISFVQLSN